MSPCRTLLLWAALAALPTSSPARAQAPEPWDTRPDAWVATDALGRSTPLHPAVPAPRANRTVGIFYFLWMGEHGQEGPFDINRIRAQDPDAAQKPDSPLWGPMLKFHWWGESLFGHYLSSDPYVFRKHAQMLADAGVDAVIFDVTNNSPYTENYLTLLRVFDEFRRDGGRPPKVAFLCPFGNPTYVVKSLFENLYGKGLYSDLWFRWEGKPLIMADPSFLRYEERIGGASAATELQRGHTLGQSFTTDADVTAVGMKLPTYYGKDSSVTLALRRGGPDGDILARKRFENVTDNAEVLVEAPEPLPPGTYTLEMSDPAGRVGWYGRPDDAYKDGTALADGAPVAGDRQILLRLEDNPYAAMVDTFTFRKPQPSYFTGPMKEGEWGWLEVFPQHVFTSPSGEPEEMVVGVAQNAVDGQLGALSNPRAHGRSFSNGRQPGPEGQDFTGKNVQEQWARALEVDPPFLFLTGWNEWVAMRFGSDSKFHGAGPVTFVDQYNTEYSRDIEPMKGGHGDAYYYQMVDYIRRYKGARAPEAAGEEKTILVDGKFDDWADVTPEYRDDRNDTPERDHPGWGKDPRFVNRTGRNDFHTLKAARDADNLYFMARTMRPITGAGDGHWMQLYLDLDANPATGWLGYDVAVNRAAPGNTLATVEAYRNGAWRPVALAPLAVNGDGLELSIPRRALRLPDGGPLRFDFKWMDNTDPEVDVLNLYRDGDTAPNGRFNYRYIEPIANGCP